MQSRRDEALFNNDLTKKGEGVMENEVMVYDDNVPSIADDSLLRVAEMAERRIDAVIKIKQMALKVTNATDWNDQGGRPYLQVSGSEKVANLFNISWRLDEPTIETELDGHFTYTMRGIFSIPGRSISCEGSRSSKDPFFKKYEWRNGEKTEKPISAIDRRDVRMAALTNLLGNGITRLLGIRNLSYDDLEKYAGITKEMVATIDYKGKGGDKVSSTVKSKGTAGGQSDTDKTKTVNDTLAEELAAYCPDPAMRPALLKQITAFKDKEGAQKWADDISKMSNKWAGTALGKLRELAKKKDGGDLPANCPKNPRECEHSGWVDGKAQCGPEGNPCPFEEVKG